MQPFNLLDRQIAVLRCDPCISPSSDGQLLHHEINGSAQRPKMTCVAVPVRRSLRNLICRYPVYVGRKIEFHHRPGIKRCLAAVRLRLRMFNSSGNGCREQSRHSFRARPRNSACLGRCCITFPPPNFFAPFFATLFQPSRNALASPCEVGQTPQIFVRSRTITKNFTIPGRA